MAIPKVCGIETEYGIIVRGAETNPVAASSLLINAYVAASTGRERRPRSAGTSRTSTRQRRPGLRSSTTPSPPRSRPTSSTPCSPTAPATTSTTPTPSSPRPSAPTALEAVVLSTGPPSRSSGASMAPRPAELLPAGPGDRRLQEQLRRQGQQLRLPRELPAGPARCRSAGSSPTSRRTSSPARSSPAPARSAARLPGVAADDVPFQLTQRADFFEEEVGLETTLKRPIVNTRDEPHCDAQKYRRLHVIVGDANMTEVATFLKVGTTAIVLAMIEDDAARRRLAARPTRCRRCARSATTPSLPRTILELRRRPPVTALEMQWELLERARKYAEHGRARASARRSARDVLRRWEQVLTGLETDPMSSPTRSTGWPSTACSTATASATTSARTTPGCRRWTCSTTTCAPSKSLFARVGLQHARRRRRGRARPMTEPPTTPGPTSGASACRSGPTTSWPPTGTRWCSTSAAIRSGGCR